MRGKKKNGGGKLPTYQDRLILFIDFLGFSEIVGTTSADDAALRRLVKAMDRLGEIGDVKFLKSQRVTQFSDSIVASYMRSSLSRRSARMRFREHVSFPVSANDRQLP